MGIISQLLCFSNICWVDHILKDKCHFFLPRPFGGYYLRKDICIERITSKFSMFDNISHIYSVLNSNMHPSPLLCLALYNSLIFNFCLIYKQISLLSCSQFLVLCCIAHSKVAETNAIYIFTPGKRF